MGPLVQVPSNAASAAAVALNSALRLGDAQNILNTLAASAFAKSDDLSEEARCSNRGPRARISRQLPPGHSASRRLGDLGHGSLCGKRVGRSGISCIYNSFVVSA